MTFEIINVGELPNDGTGDPVRVAFIKINNNFSISNSITSGLEPNGPEGAIQIKGVTTVGSSTVNTFVGTNYLKITNTNLDLGYNILPLGNGAIDIGSSSNTIGNLYISSSAALYLGNVKVTESGNSLSFTVSGSTDKPNMSLGNLTVQQSINYGNTLLDSTVITTPNITSNQILIEMPLTDFSNGEFNIVSRQTGGQRSQSANISVTKTNSGSDVQYVVYGTIFTGTALTTYDAKVSYGNLQITVSPLLDSEIIHTINYQINM